MSFVRKLIVTIIRWRRISWIPTALFLFTTMLLGMCVCILMGEYEMACSILLILCVAWLVIDCLRA